MNGKIVLTDRNIKTCAAIIRIGKTMLAAKWFVSQNFLAQAVFNRAWFVFLLNEKAPTL